MAHNEDNSLLTTRKDGDSKLSKMHETRKNQNGSRYVLIKK